MSTIMSLGTGTITIGGDLTVGRMAGPSVLSHGPAAWDLRSSARRYPSVLCALLDLSAHPDRCYAKFCRKQPQETELHSQNRHTSGDLRASSWPVTLRCRKWCRCGGPGLVVTNATRA